MGDIGRRISEILKKQNMTQKALAHRACITEVMLSRYITGDRDPKPETIANIATALNTTSDYLLGIEDSEFYFPEIKRIIARNASKMSNGEKRELINALFGEG